ncbi:hypothetical protein HPP92_028033, partial [Vanilla planifolia]
MLSRIARKAERQNWKLQPSSHNINACPRSGKVVNERRFQQKWRSSESTLPYIGENSARNVADMPKGNRRREG